MCNEGVGSEYSNQSAGNTRDLVTHSHVGNIVLCGRAFLAKHVTYKPDLTVWNMHVHVTGLGP